MSRLYCLQKVLSTLKTVEGRGARTSLNRGLGLLGPSQIWENHMEEGGGS